MTAWRDPRVVIGALVGLLLVGLAVAQALRDTTPPSLWVEAPERVAAGGRFDVVVTADEPASYLIEYGGARIERVEQDLTVTLTAARGSERVRVTATDGAGNVAESTHAVEGVVVPRARLEAPAELRPGDPYTVAVRFSPADAPREGVVLSGGTEGLDAAVHETPDGAYLLGVVPLGSDPDELRFEARWRDGLGRDGAVARTVPVAPLGQPVEQLSISAATLSVITPEGRALEEEALATVVPDPNAPPAWTEPFVAPIAGRGTSGFGSPRRYVVGGPVSFHEGEDIAAPTGTTIRATNAGTVVLAGTYPIKGGLTIIDHGAGVTSRYFHQSAIHVRAGQEVARGEPIGEVGSTGLSTGPHLHWEMWIGDTPSYPLAWTDRLRP